MTKIKEQGGLGIGRIIEKKIALLGKWLWRFASENGVFWQSIIQSRYGVNPNEWNCKLSFPSSWSLLWKQAFK